MSMPSTTTPTGPTGLASIAGLPAAAHEVLHREFDDLPALHWSTPMNSAPLWDFHILLAIRPPLLHTSLHLGPSCTSIRVLLLHLGRRRGLRPRLPLLLTLLLLLSLIQLHLRP